MSLRLNAKLTPGQRRAERERQTQAALAWQAARKELLEVGALFLRYSGSETSFPKVGRRGAREEIPSVLVAAHEVLEAEEAERRAREEFRATLG